MTTAERQKLAYQIAAVAARHYDLPVMTEATEQLTRAISDILFAADAAPASGVTEWQPIETRPRDAGPTWVAHDSGTMVVAYYHGPSERWRVMWCDRVLGWIPTRWLPLPERPDPIVGNS